MKLNTLFATALLAALAAGQALCQTSAPARKGKWMKFPITRPINAPYTTPPAAAPVQPYAASDEDVKALKQALTGPWFIQIMPEGDDAPPPILALGSFFDDGNFVGTESDELAPPITIASQGQWAATGPGAFKIRFTLLAFDGQDYIGMFKIRVEAKLGESKTDFSGTFHVDFFDTNGTPQGGGDGKLTATHVPMD